MGHPAPKMQSVTLESEEYIIRGITIVNQAIYIACFGNRIDIEAAMPHSLCNAPLSEQIAYSKNIKATKKLKFEFSKSWNENVET